MCVSVCGLSMVWQTFSIKGHGVYSLDFVGHISLSQILILAIVTGKQL